MLDKKVPVTLQIDIENKFYDDDLNSFNIIGEIPGTDKAKADEIVMLGAHFDSCMVAPAPQTMAQAPA